MRPLSTFVWAFIGVVRDYVCMCVMCTYVGVEIDCGTYFSLIVVDLCGYVPIY